MTYPDVRPRRLRRTAAMRRLVDGDPARRPAELVLPMFVREGLTEPRPIEFAAGRRAAHPRVAAQGGGRRGAGRRRRPHALRRAVGAGTRSARAALDPDGILNVAIADVVAEVGDATVVMSDLCLDEFTSHGHCGVLAADGSVDNDATLERLRARWRWPRRRPGSTWSDRPE